MRKNVELDMLIAPLLPVLLVCADSLVQPVYVVVAPLIIADGAIEAIFVRMQASCRLSDLCMPVLPFHFRIGFADAAIDAQVVRREIDESLFLRLLDFEIASFREIICSHCGRWIGRQQHPCRFGGICPNKKRSEHCLRFLQAPP